MFARWFAGRGWAPRAHQLELLAKAQAGRSVLLIAPTGGGKTLAGFLPTLVELATAPRPAAQARLDRPRAAPSRGLHTLYISPLKALAVDIARNLEMPVARDGPADPARDPHRRHAGLEAPAPAPRSARHPAHHAGAAGAAAGVAPTRRICSARCGASCSTNCIRWSPRSAAICCRSGWRGCSRWRRSSPPSACRRRWPSPTICAASWCRSRRTARRAPIWSSREAGAQPDVTMLDTARASALGRPFGAPRARAKSTS